ncbi:MAG: AtpZ/AtpI family protein [Planctomycetota bacterium]
MMRFAGAGIELAGSALIAGAVGYWVDGQFGNAKPYCAALGVLVGFAVGMFRLIVTVSRFADDQNGDPKQTGTHKRNPGPADSDASQEG